MKNHKINDILFYAISDFDGEAIKKGVVAEKDDDHIILLADGVSYWLEEDEEHQLFKSFEEAQSFLNKQHNERMVRIDYARSIMKGD